MGHRNWDNWRQIWCRCCMFSHTLALTQENTFTIKKSKFKKLTCISEPGPNQAFKETLQPEFPSLIRNTYCKLH